jgi:outer membrane protein
MAPGTLQAESLRDALAAAYRYNPTIDAERARLRGTDEEVARAMSGYRPIVTGSAAISRDYNSTKVGGIKNSSVTYPKGYGVSLTQSLFNGFQTTNAVRESEAFVRAGREVLRAVEHQVLLDAVTAYMDVIRDQTIVRLRENNVNVLSRELKAVQDRFAVGEVTRTDVAQAQARRALAVSALDLAKAQLKTSRATYERVIGHAPNNLKEPGPDAPGLPASLDAALSAATQENPNNIAALYREQAARTTVDRIRGELLPQVNLEASYDRTYDPSENIDRGESGTIAGRVTVPIYEGGEVRARIRQAKELHVASLQEIEQFRTETQAIVTSVWSQMQAAKAQRESDQVQVDANRTALAGVREEEKVGQRTLLDVLNAELELLTAEVQLVTTRRNLVVLSYNVVASVGRLDALTTGVASEVYDPEVHYKDVRREWWSTSITHGEGTPGGWAADVHREPSK